MKLMYARPPVQALEISNVTEVKFPSMIKLSVGGVGVGLLLLAVWLAGLAVGGQLERLVTELKLALDTQPPLVFLGSIFGVLIVHEVVHCLMFPNALRSDRTVLGVLPNTGLAYAWTGLPMTRNRYLLAAVAPLVLLSILPFALFSAFPAEMGPFLPAALFNTVGAGADVMVTYFLLRQIPANGWVQLSGPGTYWGSAPSVVSLVG